MQVYSNVFHRIAIGKVGPPMLGRWMIFSRLGAPNTAKIAPMLVGMQYSISNVVTGYLPGTQLLKGTHIHTYNVCSELYY